MPSGHSKEVMGTLQPGQRVKFLNDVGSATVVRIEGATVVVEDEDGFERSVDQAELLVAPDPEEEAKQYGDTILPTTNKNKHKSRLDTIRTKFSTIR